MSTECRTQGAVSPCRIIDYVLSIFKTHLFLTNNVRILTGHANGVEYGKIPRASHFYIAGRERSLLTLQVAHGARQSVSTTDLVLLIEVGVN